MYDTIYHLILTMRYVCVGVLMFAFPSETVMPIVGYIASRGHIWLPGAIVAGILGTTAWSLMVYALARWVGPKGVGVLVARYGTFLGIQKAGVDRAGRWFDRYASAAVCLGKFVPGLRTAVCVPAGLRRMPVGRFLGYSLLGSAADVAILAYLGYTAHTSFYEVRIMVNSASNLIVVGLVLAVVGWWLLRRFR
jgi:membrane protein DedA with SNARE-associated domain